MNGEISPILFWGLIGLLAALLIAAAVFFIVSVFFLIAAGLFE